MKNTRISIKNTRILFENSRILFENKGILLQGTHLDKLKSLCFDVFETNSTHYSKFFSKKPTLPTLTLSIRRLAPHKPTLNLH